MGSCRPSLGAPSARPRLETRAETGLEATRGPEGPRGSRGSRGPEAGWQAGRQARGSVPQGLPTSSTFQVAEYPRRALQTSRPLPLRYTVRAVCSCAIPVSLRLYFFLSTPAAAARFEKGRPYGRPAFVVSISIPLTTAASSSPTMTTSPSQIHHRLQNRDGMQNREWYWHRLDGLSEGDWGGALR